MTVRFDYLAFANAPVEEVTQAGFELINALQAHEPHIQAHAAAAVFLLLCKQHRIEPQDVFTIVKNLMASEVAGHSHQYRAMEAYVQHELA